MWAVDTTLHGPRCVIVGDGRGGHMLASSAREAEQLVWYSAGTETLAFSVGLASFTRFERGRSVALVRETEDQGIALVWEEAQPDGDNTPRWVGERCYVCEQPTEERCFTCDWPVCHTHAHAVEWERATGWLCEECDE